MHYQKVKEKCLKASIARQTFDDALNSSKNNITDSFEGVGFLNAWGKIDDTIKKTLFGVEFKKNRYFSKRNCYEKW